VNRTFRVSTAIAAAAVLAGCGGGADTQQLAPAPGSGTQSTYTGPAPATADVQAFMVEVWDNLRAGGTASCGDCHSQSGGQAPLFARDDDVNLAYQETNPLVDLASPSDSRLVTKVFSDGSGHNCWVESPQACADIMTTWIENWVGGSGSGGGREIELQAPALLDVGDSKNFPDDPGLFAAPGGIHDLLTQYCAECHSSAASAPQNPYFADADVATAYAAVKSKINLDDPASSRLVLRLRNEFHNCWSDCDANADEMQTRIEAFSGQITLDPVDPTLVLSKALTLYDGTVASGGNRYEGNQIALWEFKAGQGSTAFDTSGVDPAIDLTLSGDDVSWVGGWGIDIKSGKAQGSTAASKKLHDLIKGTGEYSIEAWVVPGNVGQEDARIVSYSAGTVARNFNLGQTLYSYDFFNRSGNTDGNGDPVLTTSAADEDLQATLQHVVANYDPVNGRSIYVNGVFTDDMDPAPGGTLADWDDTFAFVLGNEVSGDRQWQGLIRMVAIHNRLLTPEQIQQNFDVGVGEKFFLLFFIGDLINVPEAYILFEVSQFDSYSYLFNQPTFISLDATVDPGNIPLQGMRIGVNAVESPVGQAYRTLDTAITSAQYDPATGQVLSSLGTVIGLQKGPDADMFFLSFEVLGGNTKVYTDPAGLTPAAVDGPPQSDIGLRTFDEINFTMSAVTGVTTTDSNVEFTYNLVRQSLPTVESIETFAAAHETAIAQLSIEYCNALVEDATARSAYFAGFDFGVGPATAFAGANRDLVIDPLIDNMVGVGLGSQPDFVDIRNELGYNADPQNLIDRLVASPAPPGVSATDRTEDITKAVCSAVLGSAAMLVQ
jgi:hypothetical protein